MTIWRAWPAFAGISCAFALAYRGDWASAILAAVIGLLPAAAWVRDELAATRAKLREHPELAETHGRHRRHRHRGVLQPRVSDFPRQRKGPFPVRMTSVSARSYPPGSGQRGRVAGPPPR